MDYDIGVFSLLSFVTLLGGLIFCWVRRPALGSRLILLALLLRIAGSLARYEVLVGFYDGVGDATMYYAEGLSLAEQTWGPLSGPATVSGWAPDSSRWWGTNFICWLSGMVLTVIGPTMRGELLVFSLASFFGLWAIVTGVQRLYPSARPVESARWLWLWPSLIFWPSTVGKESVLLLAIGLSFLGHVGRRGRKSWPTLLCGIALASAVRPHVAALIAMSSAVAHWLALTGRVDLRRSLEGVFLVAIGAFAIAAMGTQFGLANADLEGVQEFIGHRSKLTRLGGSSLGEAPSGVLGVPMAFVNVWMRPFPWEAHNVTAAFSSAEIVFFWWQALRRRRQLLRLFRNWKQHPLLHFAVPFLVGYTLMIGMTFANLGIIARQRTLATPFLLLLLAVPPARARGGRP